MAWDVNAGLRNRHPLLSFRENDPLLLCFTFSRFFTHGEIGERKESSIGCMKSYFRGRYGKQRTPLVIFLFAFAASVFRYMFGLFKKNGISSTLSCFFIDRTWKISSENEPFSPSHMCVYIVFTQMPSDIFIYTSFLCEGAGGRQRQASVGWGNNFYERTSVKYGGDSAVIIRRYADVVIFLHTSSLVSIQHSPRMGRL